MFVKYINSKTADHPLARGGVLDLAKLNKLVKELETIEKGRKEQGENSDFSELLSHVRNDSYDRNILAQELIDHQCKFFAQKLMAGYYEESEVVEEA